MSLGSRFVQRARSVLHRLSPKSARRARATPGTPGTPATPASRPRGRSAATSQNFLEPLESRVHLSVAAYTITDLGTLGGTTSAAYGINTSGQVVGQSMTAAGTEQAFLYSGGSIIDLGDSFGGTTSIANGINDSGDVVGQATNSAGVGNAFLYLSGAMYNLGTLAGADSYATAINNNGSIVGYSTASTGYENAFGDSIATSASPGMVDLGTLGGDASYTFAVNSSNDAVGWSDETVGGATQPMLYTPAPSITDLGTLGGATGIAFGVNNNGEIVGESANANGVNNATVWSGGSIYDLGTLVTNGSSVALGVNNSGTVVGYATNAVGNQDAFVNFSNTGMADLNDLIAPGSGWSLTQATAVNASGQIVGYGTNPEGQVHAFLLTPTGTTLPAASVTSNAQIITSGTTTTSALNGTYFGSVSEDAPVIDHVFTIADYGGADLTIGTVSVPTGYTLVYAPATSIAPGTTTSFTVGLNTTTPGTYNGDISFTTSDADNDPYTFGVSGMVTAATVNVSGDGQPITNKSTITSTTNGTDFPNAVIESTGDAQTFTIANSGNSDLTIGTITVPSHYALVTEPATTVDPGSSTSFVVDLTTTKIGTFTGNISFATNDPANPKFVFKITGEVLAVGQGQDEPSIGSFTTNGPVTKGTDITLTAGDVTIAPPGTIKAVDFYAGPGPDFSTADKLIGVGKTIDGTDYSLVTTTTKLAVGTDTFWVRILDSYGRYDTPMSVTAVIEDDPPKVTKLTLDPTTPVAGAKLVLKAAGVSDPYNTVTSVTFYWDPTNTGTLTNAIALGTVTAKNGWSLTTTLNSATAAVNPFPTTGTATFIVQAIDASGTLSMPLSVNPTVNTPPALASVTPSSGTVAVGGSVKLTAAGVTDPNDTIKQVSFYLGQPGDTTLNTATDKLLGKGAPGAKGSGLYTYTYKVAKTVAPNTYPIFVIATNSHGATSPVATTSLVVTAATPAVDAPATVDAAPALDDTQALSSMGPSDANATPSGAEAWLLSPATPNTAWTLTPVLDTTPDTL